MKSARFVSFDEVISRFSGKRIAIVGSGPSCARNEPGLVDSFDLVLRVNNYVTGPGQGFRCDVFYSFFGASIKKTTEELIGDGVTLCMSKVPDCQPIESSWHRMRRKMNGVDFRYIYRDRVDFWFCDTFIPDADRFRRGFNLLRKHVPTTGFAAILDVVDCAPAEIFITGFDGFTSGIHNVTQRWRKGNPRDPIGHRPELELDWISWASRRYPMTFDPVLSTIVRKRRRIAA